MLLIWKAPTSVLPLPLRPRAAGCNRLSCQPMARSTKALTWWRDAASSMQSARAGNTAVARAIARKKAGIVGMVGDVVTGGTHRSILGGAGKSPRRQRPGFETVRRPGIRQPG